MIIQQISIFLENVAGRLAEVTKLLAKEGINIRAMTIADTADFGILRIVVDQPDKTLKALRDAGFTARATEVLAVEVEDKPGGLAKVMEIFKQNQVNIEYLYVSLEKNKDKAVVIFKVEDLKLGKKIVEEHGLGGTVNL
jgi:hypothetical protein